MKQPKAALSEKIFNAMDCLMAKEGLHHLSMHKLAKEAGIAAGTIYLYFQNKDELLTQFAQRVFTLFMATLEKDFDESESFFSNTDECGGIFGTFYRKIQRLPPI